MRRVERLSHLCVRRSSCIPASPPLTHSTQRVRLSALLLALRRSLPGGSITGAARWRAAMTAAPPLTVQRDGCTK